jgi:uncharacterized protein YodC (DUF2158 family)
LNLNEECDFKVGDIVKLKSGGPKMTVCEVHTILETQVECSWFSRTGKHQDALLRGFYPPRALELITEASASDDSTTASGIGGSGTVKGEKT